MAEYKAWQELPIGGIIDEAGNSVNYKTGSWRSFRPIFNAEKCTGCLLCWFYCPEGVIHINENGKVDSCDLDYCKGCGICFSVCPVNAIKFVPEEEADAKEVKK